MDDVAGLEHLDVESVRFVFQHLAPGAPELQLESLRRHADVDGLLQPIRMLARGAAVSSVGEVVERAGEVLVRSEHADGTRREWTFQVDGDGRIVAVSAGRPVDGVDFSTGSPADLSATERTALQELFATAYTAPDPDYLDHQLGVMSCLAVARRDSEIVGVALQGAATVTTATLGAVRLQLPGLVCVNPREHRTGVGQGMGNRVTWLNLSTNGPSDVAAPRFATPASLAMAMKGQGQFVWPPADEPFALYDHPTASQIALAHEAARAHGNAGYDPATGACLGLGRPIGSPNVEPDVPEEYHTRFDKIDRERGDSLLYLRWTVEPPRAWLER